MSYPIPDNEAKRLAVLHSYALLDSQPEEQFDRLTRMAAHMFQVPIVLVCLIDENRQWYKSCYGLDFRETERGIAFCAHTIIHDEPLVVPDATLDPRFADNPLVIGEPHVRFYAGCSLKAPEGYNIGTFSIVDFKPRELDQASLDRLCDFAAMAMNEIRLRRSENQFRKLVEKGQDIVAILSPDGRVIYESPSLETVLGWKPDEVLGQMISQIMHPDDVQAVTESLQRLVEDPTCHEVLEFRSRHRDGSWRWVEASATNNLDDPTIGGLIATSRDITRRKEIEAKLKDSEDRFKAVFEQSPIGMGLMALDGTWQRVNMALGEILGYATESLLNRNFQEFTLEEDREQVLRLMGQSLSNEFSTFSVEKRYVRQDGEVIWGAMNVTLLRDTVGAPQAFLCQIQDITERRRANWALLTAKTEADQAREEAERANAAKNELLSRVSHELRTPLNAILGFSQLLDMSPQLRDRDRESVRLILKSGQHLLGLINEVLDISRIESGRLALSPEPVNVRELVLEVLELVRPMVDEAGINLDAGPALNSTVFVRADRQRLRQIIYNLATNAVKFNRPQGKVNIWVEEVPDENRARICVRDEGQGISLDMQGRLFQPFERLEAARHGVEGSGIGLAIARRLAQAMGGNVDLKSALGDGSTFWVELPIVEDPLVQINQAIREPGMGPSGHDFVVLYIEDNLSSIRLMQGLLAQRQKVTLLTALEGYRGVEMARLHVPDLIVLDLHLPGMAGMLVMDQLQELTETRDIPIVVLSADDSTRRMERVKRLGASAVLQKPLDVDEFLLLLDGFLSQRD